MLNAFRRSENKTLFIRPLSIFKSRLFVDFSNDVVVECDVRNLNWLLVKMLFSFIKEQFFPKFSWVPIRSKV